jgi:hypothetical protein
MSSSSAVLLLLWPLLLWLWLLQGHGLYGQFQVSCELLELPVQLLAHRQDVLCTAAATAAAAAAAAAPAAAA